MDYLQYYIDEIKNETKGFKPVYGGTGLGKTYGLRKAISKALEDGCDKKFIYVTNRHVLIQELAKDLTKKGHNVAYLKADSDTFKELLYKSKNCLKELAFDLIRKDFFQYHKNKNKDYLQQLLTTKINKIRTNFQDLQKSWIS